MDEKSIDPLHSLNDGIIPFMLLVGMNALRLRDCSLRKRGVTLCIAMGRYSNTLSADARIARHLDTIRYLTKSVTQGHMNVLLLSHLLVFVV